MSQGSSENERNEGKVKFLFPLKYIFFIESGINLITMCLCFFIPEWFIGNIIGTYSGFNHVLGNILGWYGTLLFVITFVLLKFLLKKNLEGVLVVLQAYFLGDILQLVFTITLIISISGATFGAITTIIITVILMGIRVLVFMNPQRLGL